MFIKNKEWDVFICHAFEDKNSIARPLALALEQAGLKVWFDEFSLKIGDSLSRSINFGLANSKYGIVIISKNFLNKEWPQKELGGLIAKEDYLNKVVLPVWHDITIDEIRQHYPILADKVAAKSDLGIHELSRQLRKSMNLTFEGVEIIGLWVGRSGNLRLYNDGDIVAGDYDWDGFKWAGHIRGRYLNNIFRFNWWWDITLEKGNGYLEYIENVQMLRGGWAFDFEEVDIYTQQPDKIKDKVQSWQFVRVRKPSLTDLRG